MQRRGIHLLAVLAWLAGASPVAARGRDFIDETLFSSAFHAGEIGLEVGAESRLDTSYRLQGWYRAELEIALTRRLFVEGVGEFAARGRGLEWGGFRAGGRMHLGRPLRLPADATLAVEFEEKTAVGKLPGTERELIARLVVTRTLVRDVLVTANVGPAHRFTPRATRLAYGFGARWPENRPLMAGIEWNREPLELSTRITPQIWLRFPNAWRLRLGGVFGVDPRPYWFVARAILEVEF